MRRIPARRRVGARRSVPRSAELAEFIGDRAFALIPVDTPIDAGAAVTLSSDWDADPLSPLSTIEGSLTMETEAVGDLATAIGLVTLDAADALGLATVTGSIEVGKAADYVVVDRNLLDVEPEEISDTEVLMIVLSGTETYLAAGF